MKITISIILCCLLHTANAQQKVDKDISGIIIFNTTDTLKVKQWMANDPFIRNKIFTYQLYNWFGIPDQKLLPSEKKKN